MAHTAPVYEFNQDGQLVWSLFNADSEAQFHFFNNLLNSDDVIASTFKFDALEQDGRDLVTPPTPRIAGCFPKY